MEVLHHWYVVEGPRVHGLAIDNNNGRDNIASQPENRPWTYRYSHIEVTACLLTVWSRGQNGRIVIIRRD